MNIFGIRPIGAPEEPPRLEIVDLATGQAVLSYPVIPPRQLAHWIDFAPDGKAVLCSMSDGKVHATAIDTGKELFTAPGHTNVSQYHAFSADGRVLVTGAFGHQAEEAAVRVIDLKTGKEVAKFHPGTTVSAVAASGDGRRVAASSANFGQVNHALPAIVWDVASGKELARVPQHGEGGFIALSPDGRTVAVASRWKGDVRVWEVASRSERFHFKHDGEITGLAFAPDGRVLAAASKEAPVYLWDLTGELAKPLPDWNGQRVWDELGSNDAAKAFTAIRQLRANPALAAALLRERARPPAAPDAERRKKLLAELSAADFQAREKASEALASFGESIQSELQAELGRAASGEVRTRLQRLLDRLQEPTPERLRLIRAVEAVETLTTPEAKALLDSWASGSAGPTLKSEAQAALARRART
jgi:hypothetical protein